MDHPGLNVTNINAANNINGNNHLDIEESGGGVMYDTADDRLFDAHIIYPLVTLCTPRVIPIRI